MYEEPTTAIKTLITVLCLCLWQSDTPALEYIHIVKEIDPCPTTNEDILK